MSKHFMNSKLLQISLYQNKVFKTSFDYSNFLENVAASLTDEMYRFEEELNENKLRLSFESLQNNTSPGNEGLTEENSNNLG